MKTFETPIADEILILCKELESLEHKPTPSVLTLRAIRTCLQDLTIYVVALERQVQQLAIDVRNKTTLPPFDGTK